MARKRGSGVPVRRARRRDGYPLGPGRRRFRNRVVVSVVAIGAPVAVSSVVGIIEAIRHRSLDSAGLAAYHFLEFYVGVFALVALSMVVVIGLCATNRGILTANGRVMLQTAHRLISALAMGCLALHVSVKVAQARARPIDVVIPFLDAHRRLFVGLGTLAAYLMLLLAWTGLIRRRFALSQRAWMWRSVHIAAYPAWLLAIVHGLSAGRHAARWVTASYVVCAGAVGLALLVRVSLARGRRGRAPNLATDPVPVSGGPR